MISVEPELIDQITATFHYLRAGKVPPPIPIPDDLPDNEIRQLITYVNRFLVEFATFAEAMEQIAQGELDTRPLVGRMAAAHSFKALHSNLRHLTWKTQQVASGDLEQQVDFMGDFSTAFNSMTQQLKDSREQLIDLNQELERRNRFIRETFGRYTSDDIVGVLLDMPEGLKIGGEKREITLLMSDLRGFTALAERLEPPVVVSLLNFYLSAMIEIIHQYGGTIDEIIGDAIFVLFGAPLVLPDAAKRAVLCALEMQKAMLGVNEHNLQRAWPEIEMGIALHSGEVVVGNIGSTKRSKYGVVGKAVNLTARIESFTVGGQVLLSPTLVQAAGQGLANLVAHGPHSFVALDFQHPLQGQYRKCRFPGDPSARSSRTIWSKVSWSCETRCLRLTKLSNRRSINGIRGECAANRLWYGHNEST